MSVIELRTHLADFMGAYDLPLRLTTLNGLTRYECTAKI
jgi:hypothetical protein